MGGGGLGMQFDTVVRLTLPQLYYLCHDSSAKSGIDTKQAIDAKFKADKRYREQYQKQVQDAIRLAKESLI